MKDHAVVRYFVGGGPLSGKSMSLEPWRTEWVVEKPIGPTTTLSRRPRLPDVHDALTKGRYRLIATDFYWMGWDNER